MGWVTKLPEAQPWNDEVSNSAEEVRSSEEVGSKSLAQAVCD